MTLQKALNGTNDIPAITEPILVDLVTKLHANGWKIENQKTGIIFHSTENWTMFYSKVAKTIQTYYLGYGHCAQTCSLLSFRDSDHIILWQEKNKSVELTEQPELRKGCSIYW